MRESLRSYGVQAALAGVALIWGGTFIVVKDGVALYPLYSFLGLRFAIAAFAFVVVLPASVKRLTWGTVRAGLLVGAVLAIAYVLQTWGLQDTTASNGAFITGMFVVITPMMQAIVQRRLPRAATVAGVTLAVTGLWLLSGGGDGGWNVGDTRVLLGAFAWSAHMMLLGWLTHDHDTRSFTLVQLVTVAVACSAIAAFTEPLALPREGSVWFAIVFTGVFASAVAFAVQTYAQRFLSPSKTALILITEPAFGGLFGWMAGERLGLQGAVGAALIFAGMVVSEILGMRSAERAGEHVELEMNVAGPPVPMVEE